MSEINVYGKALAEIKPDVAALNVTVGTKGYMDLETAKNKFAQALTNVRTVLSEFSQPNIVVSEKGIGRRNWHDSEKDADYHSVYMTVSVKIPSTEKDVLNSLAKILSGLENVSIYNSWEISKKLWKEVNDSLLGEAVVDAKRQVTAVAESLGLQVGNPIVIAEPSLFPVGGGREDDHRLYGARAAALGSSSQINDFDELDINLDPEPVEVSVKVAVSYFAE